MTGKAKLVIFAGVLLSVQACGPKENPTVSAPAVATPGTQAKGPAVTKPGGNIDPEQKSALEFESKK